jgi:hypothetical protein
VFHVPDAAGRRDLKETVAHAATVPWYRRAWGGRVPSWSQVPLLDKATAASHQEHLRHPDAAVSVGVISSSTTRDGRPLRVLRAATDPGPTVPASHIEVLRIVSPRHGLVTTSLADELVVSATLHDTFVELVIDLLREHEPPQMVVPLSTLKWLTVAMQQRGVAPATLAPRVISVTGYPLTPAAQAWLSTSWRTNLVDHWSMSELAGHTQPCRHCGAAHWVGAPLFAEVIAPSSARRVSTSPGARGELVVTTLLPDAFAMPLVRYRTGDLVEVGPSCRANAGSHGLIVHGRCSHSIVVGDRVLASSGALLALGESLADVAQVPHPAEVLGLVGAADLGVPKMRAQLDNGIPTVDVELRYDPARFARRALEVVQAVHAVVDAEVVVRLHPPGALDLQRLMRKL